VLAYILTALAAYLLGSIPTGYLVAKAKGIDIRSVGSGNIGATNTMRALGKPAGILVLLLDVAKGWLACVLSISIYILCTSAQSHHIQIGAHIRLDEVYYKIPSSIMIVAGIFAVLGHNYTCWLKFKGGKGIATTAGVYLALAPLAVGIALVVFILALLLTRYVSVGSISAAIALPAAVWVLAPHNVLLGVVTTALGALAIYKHKANIKRLVQGTENRFGKKVVSQASSPVRSGETPGQDARATDKSEATK